MPDPNYVDPNAPPPDNSVPNNAPTTDVVSTNPVVTPQTSVDAGTTTPAMPTPEKKTAYTPQETEQVGLQNLDTESANATAGAALKAKEAASQAGILQKQFDFQQQKSADIAAVADRYNKMDELSRTQDAKDILAAGAVKTDPNHWWNSKDTGGKMAAGIGLILGGLGQGLMAYGGSKGAHNLVLDQMESAIKDDIDSQDKNKASRMQSLTAIAGIHRDSAAAHHLELADKQQQLINGLSAFQIQLAQDAAANGGPDALQNNAVAQQTIEERKDQLRSDRGNVLARAAAGAQAQLNALDKAAQVKQDEIDKENRENAAALALAGAKDTASARESAAKDTRESLDKLDVQHAGDRALITGAEEAATHGETPSPAAIQAAARLGITLPDIKNSWHNLKSDEDVRNAYAPLYLAADKAHKTAREAIVANGGGRTPTTEKAPPVPPPATAQPTNNFGFKPGGP